MVRPNIIVNMKTVYIRFLAAALAVDSLSEFGNVDETAKQLLNIIALRHAQGKAITVSEAMELNTIASPATIHRKLDVLLDVGLIKQFFIGKNRRKRYLEPTKVANKYFDSLGELMKQALLSS